jgi:mannan endo-1,4-beta-mannosidase
MKNKITILLSVFFLVSCKSASTYRQLKHDPSDKNATKETAALYKNMFLLRDKGYMFGHQDALAYGVNWRYEEGRSDVKDVTGDYPAVYGWDLGRTENNEAKDIDGVPFSKQKQYIKEVYDRGGISTFSWHMNNPLSGGDSWDNAPGTVAAVLPGGAKHEVFKKWLDNAAAYLLTLKGSDGKAIPILYRPYHEFTGNWFWWCKNTTTPNQFKQLWKFTVDYFKQKGVHNLLYVYNTSNSGVATKEDFMEYYPGDDYVDIVSFDIYQGGEEVAQRQQFEAESKNLVSIIDEVGKEHNKLTAIAEAGFEQIPYATWWTETLTNGIGNHNISYVLLWRNHGWNDSMNPPRMHYYAPYKGHKYEKDFVDYYNLPQTLFQKEITKLNLYK